MRLGKIVSFLKKPGSVHAYIQHKRQQIKPGRSMSSRHIKKQIEKLEASVQMMDERVQHIESRVITIEERAAHMEERLKIMDQDKWDELIERLTHIENKVDERLAQESSDGILQISFEKSERT